MTPAEPPVLDGRPSRPTFAYLRASSLAGAEAAFEGHYNVSYRALWNGQQALVRHPKPVETGFDPRMMTEATAMRAASAVGVQLPRLLFEGDDYLVTELIAHPVADVAAPEWSHWYADLIDQVSALHASSRANPHIPDLRAWETWLRTFHEDLHSRLCLRYSSRFEEIGLTGFDALWQHDMGDRLASTKCTLLHADLHPANLLTDGRRVWVLDWELALDGDPVWDVATALHRTPWASSADEARATDMWLAHLAAIGRDDATATLARYRRLEVWKSLLVDTVRYPRLFAAADAAQVAIAVASFVQKLARATDFMSVTALDPDAVHRMLTRWSNDGLV